MTCMGSVGGGTSQQECMSKQASDYISNKSKGDRRAKLAPFITAPS